MSIRPQRPAPATPAPGKLPVTELSEMKARRQPIVMVTAYDAPGGRLADRAGADLVLVGDSAAMTVLGHDSTVPATMEEMLILTRAVTRGASRPLVIADMPFGSFQVSVEDAVENAIRFVKEAGADAVKLEGAGAMLSRVRGIVDAGIPVMGHLGLTPQSATMLGGFKAQGRSAEKALRLYDDAHALEAAGCFSLVLEAVPAPVAGRITRDLSIPTIGIGAGPDCDGQVLVWHDILGLYEALRRDRRGDPDGADRVRLGRPRAPVPRGAAHVCDARGGAGRVRGSALRESRTHRASRLGAPLHRPSR
jgi:3-methyl-2-oxobutanoate hydroxymethyltransferase